MNLKARVKDLLGIGAYRNRANLEIRERNRHVDRCYILGCGPSINDLQLSILKDAFCISVSNFFEHPDIETLAPQFHVFAASHLPITERVFTNWCSRADERLPQQTSILYERRDEGPVKRAFKNRKSYAYSYGGDLPVDLTRALLSPASVAQVALQLAIYIGAKEIVLLGVSSGWYAVSGYRHFYSTDKPSLEYYLRKEGITLNDESHPNPTKEDLYNIYSMYQIYERLNTAAIKQGLKILNGDPFSHFDVFPRIEIPGLARTEAKSLIGGTGVLVNDSGTPVASTMNKS